MVSAQISGLVRMYRQTPDGNKTLMVQDRVESLAPAGGASEGAAASVSTPEKLATINSPIVLVNDDILLITYEPDAAETTDASDCIWRIPLVAPSGTKALGRTQFANPTLIDQALVASKEVTIAGYKIVEGSARLAGKIFLDIQDNS